MSGSAPNDGGPPAPLARPGALDADARRWVDRTLADLTLRQAAAQLVIPWIPGGYQSADDPELEELAGWAEEGLGGVVISLGVPDAYVAKLNRLQSRALVPLLVTADFENGGPGMRINHSYAFPSMLPQGGGTDFPPTMAFGAAGSEELAFAYGRITAREARAVGVHWLFAPVVDVNSNPANPVIGTRSFGEDPETVGRLGAAFVRGARAGGALSTAKHFPGHGDTRTDSHFALPVIAADRERMDRVELLPFRAAIDAGVDAVMTAHVAVPEVQGDDLPATLSPHFMTRVLRGEMGFGGILFTDALVMGAITDGYGAGEAAVLALEAGSDVLLAPAGIGVAVDAVAAAVESGRVGRARLDLSVRRLLEAKARLGLHRESRTDPDGVALRVGTAGHRAVADSVAAASMTLVRDEGGAVPLRQGASVMSVTYARASHLLAGRTFDATLRGLARVASARVDPETPWAVYDSLLHAARSADAVVVGAYLSPGSSARPGGLAPAFRAFVERLNGGTAAGSGGSGTNGERPGPGGTAAQASASPPAILVSLGDPYLLAALPSARAYLAAWGGWEVSQRAAARAVAGAAPISGRLPISIPPLHGAGEGLDRAARPLAAAGGDQELEALDALAEAGFVSGADDEEDAEAEADAPAGGPGRWTAAPPIPPCGDWAPAGALDHPGPATPPAPTGAPQTGGPRTGAPDADRPHPGDPAPPQPGDLADAHCLAGEIVVSPREVDPARVALHADSLAALDDFILAALDDSAASGAALAVVRRGQIVRLRGYGRLDWDPAAPPVTPSSIFDLASLTKVVGTTTAAIVLAQRGRIALDDRVVDHLPWWNGGGVPGAADPAKDQVTIRQLLVHQGGLPPFRRFFLEMEGREAYERAIGSVPLDYAPGDSTVYSDIGLMTVAFVVEEVAGRPLDEVLRREVWRPLGMGDTGFNPAPAQWDRVATTEFDAEYRGAHVHGVVHDENAYAIGGVSGHAGLFSSARDLAVFVQMMLDRGVAGPCTADRVSGLPCHQPRFGPVSVLAPGWVDRVTRRQSDQSSRALGWDTPSGRSSAGEYFSARSFGHTGYTGTSIWVDPAQELGVILLTNRVNPTRANLRHVPLRRGVHDRIARAILDTPPAPREATEYPR